ncbi:DctP family TRAP transporter solute-binding subunit [Paenibacillus tarimensis]
MRTSIGVGLFILFGLFTAFIIGFRPDFNGSLPIDEEQEGLTDRIVIKFSHVVAGDTPKGLAAAYFAERVRELSGDSIEIQVFPNAILHTEKTEIAALQHGEIQMIAPSFSNLNVIDPVWYVMDMPFAFRDQKDVDSALQGYVGRTLSESLHRHGMEAVAFWANGFKQMISSKGPLRVPDDFQNQTFRIQPSQLLESQFQALGAGTVRIPFNEVYGNLARGTADGLENTISNIVSKGLYRVQKYMTISNHGYLGYAVIVNGQFWDGLSEEHQQQLQQAFEDTTEWINRKTAAMDERQLSIVEKSGRVAIHYLTEEERALWVERFKPLYAQYEKTIGRELMAEIGGPE